MKRCVRSTIPTRFFPIHVIEIPPLKLRDSPDGLSRVRDQAYCILHGPRQTGKPSDCWLWRTCSMAVREARTNRGSGWTARACGAVWTPWTEGSAQTERGMDTSSGRVGHAAVLVGEKEFRKDRVLRKRKNGAGTLIENTGA